MAYLHCHNCGWSQDDFWTYNFTKKTFKELLLFKWKHRPLGYNPESILLEDISEYIKPRYIKMDSSWARENGYKTNKIHSWSFILRVLKRYRQVKKNMFFKTYKEFKDAKRHKNVCCPECGSYKDWDID